MNTIAEMRKKRAAVYNEMKALLAKDTDETPWSDDDKTSYQALSDKLDNHDERIERLEALNAKDADEADPAKDMNDEDADSVSMSAGKSFGKGPRGPLIKQSRKGEAKGTRAARFIIGAGIAKSAASLSAGESYIRDQLGDREVAKALGSNAQTTGGALIPQEFREELVELLNAEAIVRSLGVDVIPMPNGNITLPRQATGAVATWIGENTDIVTSQQTFDDIQLSAKKLVAMVPVSNDLIRRSPLSVEMIVRQDMIKQLALQEDITLLTSAGSAYKPKGMTTYANFNHTASVATLSDVNNLLATMELDLQASNINTTGAKWIFHPRTRSFLATLTDSVGRYFFREELDRGTLFGYEYKITTQLPTNLVVGNSATNATTILFVQPNELIMADTMSMVADSSSEASYVDGGNGLVSTFSRDQTVFRVIEEIDFNVRHPQGISVTTVSGMSPSFYTANSAGSPYVVNPISNTASYAQSANPTG